MSTAALAAEVPTEVTDFGREFIQDWSKSIRKCLDEKRAILEGDPTPEQLRQARDSLKWLLRMVRVLHAITDDPDFPDRESAREVHGRLIQLEHYWRSFDFHSDPARVAEADANLKKYFPE